MNILLLVIFSFFMSSCITERPPETTSPKTSLETPNTNFCIYGGQKKLVGKLFAANDGCNNCQCLSTEKIVCSLKSCKEEARKNQE